jgi:hypothetical protein
VTWWRGFTDVETEGPPGAEAHRLRWSGGRLHLDAHPDPDADRAIHALGADACPCLALLDAWERAHVDGRFLVVSSRDVAEPIPAPSAAIALLRADLARWRHALAETRDEAGDDRAAVERLAGAAAPAETAALHRLGALLLLALDHRLQRRLQASVADVLPPDAPALEVATAARAVPLLQRLGWDGGLADVRLGDDPRIEAGTAVLAPSWLAAAWAPGLAGALPGHLVLDVTSVTPGGPADVVVAAPGKARVEMRVDRWENA